MSEFELSEFFFLELDARKHAVNMKEEGYEVEFRKGTANGDPCIGVFIKGELV